MQNKKCRVAQQYVGGSNNGGLKTEYEALNSRTKLTDSYEFIPVVLDTPHGGISLTDIYKWRKMFRSVDADIVHIRGAGVESLNAVIGAKLARRGKILVTVHGMFSDLVYYSSIKRWICRHMIEPMIFSLSDGISCVYEKAADRDVFSKFKDKMLPYVYNRMPNYLTITPPEKLTLRQKLGLPTDRPLCVYVGRVTREKGLSYLTKAMQKVMSNFCLLIVGDGDYLVEMKNECADDDRVIFVGQQTNVRDYLLSADFFISPSLHENLSISILEACAAGLPCIVTDVGGNPEIVENGKNGILIPRCSVDAIANAVTTMCDKNERIAFSESAKSVDYSKYSDENVDKQLRSVYLAMLELKNARNERR